MRRDYKVYRSKSPAKFNFPTENITDRVNIVFGRHYKFYIITMERKRKKKKVCLNLTLCNVCNVSKA